MLTIAILIAAIALLMLLGQFFAVTADYYLSIENPRPLDENITYITNKWWGFTSEMKGDPLELTGQGFADVRLFATRKQVLVSILTLGCWRPMTLVWRGNAGQHPLGDA